MSTNCSECGAVVPDDEAACDLCGTPVSGIIIPESTQVADEGRTAPYFDPDEAEIPTDSQVEGGAFCTECGWQNPTESNFCGKCGTKLQDLSVKSAATGRPPATKRAQKPKKLPPNKSGARGDKAKAADGGTSTVGRQMGMIILAGVLIVLALYMMSVVGGSDSSAPQPGVGTLPPIQGPLGEPYASRAEAIQQEMTALTGEARISKQDELINLYLSATRLDLAAAESEQLARILNTESAWVDAGNLYYDWMDMQQTARKGIFAAKAVSAYRQALEINPENLDVRTDMAIALMFHPEESAAAIQETMIVLEKDSTHVQANFNRGIMLLQINRVEQAIEAFEIVKRLVGNPNDPIYQRADQAIASMALGAPGL